MSLRWSHSPTPIAASAPSARSWERNLWFARYALCCPLRSWPRACHRHTQKLRCKTASNCNLLVNVKLSVWVVPTEAHNNVPWKHNLRLAVSFTGKSIMIQMWRGQVGNPKIAYVESGLNWHLREYLVCAAIFVLGRSWVGSSPRPPRSVHT